MMARGSFLLLLVAACSTGATNARRSAPLAAGASADEGQSGVLEEARRHLGQAQLHYRLGEFNEAADEFIVVYRLRPIPALLFNIAQAYRYAGMYDRARAFYKAYLRESSDLDSKARVEQALREMDEPPPSDNRTPAEVLETDVAATLPQSGAPSLPKAERSSPVIAQAAPAPKPAPREIPHVDAADSATGPSQQAWPTLQGIPVPTTRGFLGPPPASLKTLGEVARYLTDVLSQNQYEEVGYFRYADGFAIATRPERIATDARPVAGRRWPAARVRMGSPPQSVKELFEVNGVEGERYRSFVFLCTSGSDVDFSGGAEQSWGLWKTGSVNPEGDARLARPVARHVLYAYVYELSQDSGGRILIATSSPNTAAEHLRGAGLAVFLR